MKINDENNENENQQDVKFLCPVNLAHEQIAMQKACLEHINNKLDYGIYSFISLDSFKDSDITSLGLQPMTTLEFIQYVN